MKNQGFFLGVPGIRITVWYSVVISYLGKLPCAVRHMDMDMLWPSAPNKGVGALLWVAVKELNLDLYIGEAVLISVYIHDGNLIYVPEQLHSSLLGDCCVMQVLGCRAPYARKKRR